MINSRLIKSNDAGGGVCTSDEADIFGDSSGVALYQLNWDGSDMSGNYDGVATNVSFVNGHIDSAGSFNGSSSKVVASSGISGNLSRTISCWYKTTNTDNILVSLGSTSSADNNQFSIAPTTNTLNVYGFAGNGPNVDEVMTGFSTNLISGNWINIIVTWDGLSGGTLKAYINGVLESTLTRGAGKAYNTSVGLQLGTWISGNRWLNGSIDQVRIFNKAISAAEVSTLYAEAACEKTCTTDTPQIVPDCIAYYKLDGNATDSNGSGTLYDGTATNVSWTQGRFGSAGGFNGSSSEITLGNVSFGVAGLGASAISLSIWVNPQATQGGTNHMIDHLHTSTGGWVIQQSGTSTNTYYFALFNGSSFKVSPTITLTANVWSHLVFTINSSGVLNSYLNNVGVTISDSGYGALNNSVSLETQISGYAGSSGRQFSGKLDQVKIFDRAITAAEVTTLYNEVQCPSNASFNTVTYTGNGSTQSISGVGFQPDLVWVKSRSIDYDHQLHDVVRGAGYGLISNLTVAENFYNTITSFDLDGFTVSAATFVGTNANSQNFVAWCWKAGGAAVTNTDGSITSEVSANVDAGFSIVTFSGGNSSGTTVGHGLGSPLDLLIVKNRNDSTDQWITWHQSVEQNSTSNDTFTLKGGQILTLNTAGAAGGYSFDGQMGSIGGENLVAYCFAEKAGFSKIGSYTGNGSANGPTVTTGFEPAFVMIKLTSSANGNWQMMDNKRGADIQLYANLSNAEGGAYDGIDFLSNGFELKTSYVEFNGNGQTYIYMAFANQF
jgi:hypothetical protein